MRKRNTNKSLSGNYILDSFALLAMFSKEEGWEEVARLIKAAFEGKAYLFLNSVNLVEVLYSTSRKGGSAEKVLKDIERLPITILDPTKRQVLKVANLKTEHTISLADCYLAITAQTVEGKVVTGDQDFKKLEKLVSVHWIR